MSFPFLPHFLEREREVNAEMKRINEEENKEKFI